MSTTNVGETIADEVSSYFRLRAERRCKVLHVTTRFVFDVARGGVGKAEVVDGLPADAISFEVHHDFLRDCFAFVVGSAEFEPVPVGEPFPEIMVTFRTVD